MTCLLEVPAVRVEVLFCVINNPKSNNLFLIIEKHQNLVFEELEPAKEVQKKKKSIGA